jgi:hypothetical protein
MFRAKLANTKHVLGRRSKKAYDNQSEIGCRHRKSSLICNIFSTFSSHLMLDRINANFSSRVRFLITISRFDAVDLSAQFSTNTNSTGPRARVYLAAKPSLCAVRRFSRSLVMPV